MMPEIETDVVVTLTPAAVEAVKELLIQRNMEGCALRVFVQGGGCSGLQYGMAFENNIREQDSISEFDGVKVVVDEISCDYLRGASVDFVNDETGSGFKIDNPNVFSCGCGSSSGDEGTGCSGCH